MEMILGIPQMLVHPVLLGLLILQLIVQTEPGTANCNALTAPTYEAATDPPPVGSIAAGTDPGNNYAYGTASSILLPLLY